MSCLKDKFKGSLLATAGFLLSPLSWWNDLYVNIPIAYVLAWLVSFMDKRLFSAAMLFFYWLTNLAGLLLLHKGIAIAALEHDNADSHQKHLLRDIFLSILYSMIIAALIYTGILRHPKDY